ncbi:melanoma-associated antigen 4-like [Sorex fumeus]|uniref:melanoma-associated antigen 4-like n=1 Tax=Sorex fumeus TaxID=62283 RepID=UPI0024ACA73D|nr:melanoma-associated antigen 4-like [Sorex fumeus]
MSRCDEFWAFKVEEENEDAQDGQHLERAQLSKAEMGMAELPSSTTATVHVEGTLGEVAAAQVFHEVKGPQDRLAMAHHFQVDMAEELDSHPKSSSASSHKGKGLEGREEPSQVGACLQEALHDKMSNLVGFLLLKYRTKQLTMKYAMLRTILNNDEEKFSFFLSQVSECTQLLFGIDVKEINPEIHSYVLVTTLGLIYHGMVGPRQTMSNTGLLVMVLGLILLENDCASEQVVWEQLGLMGVHPGRRHFIYGEPKELLTNVWVQNRYLDYRREPGSYRARYQFLWGPSAHTEIRKVEVMEFFLNIFESDNRFLTFLTDQPHSIDKEEVD